MRGKKLIFRLYQFFKYLYWLNLVLAGGMFGFQLINLFRPEKTLWASYLGKFVLSLKANGFYQSNTNRALAVHFEQMSGFPELGLNVPFHSVFILLFTVVVATVSLFYNYQFYTLFQHLNLSTKAGSPFDTEISIILRRLAWGSALIFVFGSGLSALKLVFINEIVFEGFTAKPVFDNHLFNFLWFALGTYILNEIYKIGLTLKEEQDWTI